VKLVPLAHPPGPRFEAFLAAHAPLSLRVRGALEESDGAPPVWADDPEAPRLAVHAGRGWLAPLGAAEEVIAHLADLESLSAEGAEENEWLLKLSSVPREIVDALAARRRLVRQTGCGLYTLQEEEFRPFSVGPPLESLREEDAPILAAHSQYEEGEPYWLDRIRRAPSAAVRIGGELAAWMIVHANGSIGMLYTMEKFRNQKLGRFVASALAEKQFGRGRAVYCYIVDGNAPSERVFLSLGFRRAAEVAWAVYERGPGGD